ncbi:hypothetical protein BD410DRAFT_493961 [Rickenella mellea]|uniref:Uncharacterized protein n=1 Tax=Rickenella mellea TaxID=50990 RepID=A0A4Y7PT76_9AGAM|nr:hypothetical protein BD410DRAFT_493961 [Rickenella mellea]
MFGAFTTYPRIWCTLAYLFKRHPKLPPPVHEILANPSSVHRRHPYRYHPSRGNKHHLDTPLASLYRLYEFYIADDTISFRNEIEWFWNCHTWPVHAIPDPADTKDPSRYAILGGLTEIMCMSFNRLINEGLPRDAPVVIGDFEELKARPKVIERPPEWLANVKPLTEKVFVPNGKGEVVKEEEGSPVFKKWNIFIEHPHHYFV